MGKRIAIMQSSYIPWKGYSDLINSVDEFILHLRRRGSGRPVQDMRGRAFSCAPMP